MVEVCQKLKMQCECQNWRGENTSDSKSKQHQHINTPPYAFFRYINYAEKYALSTVEGCPILTSLTIIQSFQADESDLH